MSQLISPLVKLFSLGVVWLTALFVGHFAIQQFSISDSLVHAYIAVSMFIGSLIISERILGLQLNIGVREKNALPRKAAAIEPEVLRLRDMISLLDEDDLDDLRAEVREGLRDRIRNLTADESESFEDLLADAGQKRKRGAR